MLISRREDVAATTARRTSFAIGGSNQDDYSTKVHPGRGRSRCPRWAWQVRLGWRAGRHPGRVPRCRGLAGGGEHRRAPTQERRQADRPCRPAALSALVHRQRSHQRAGIRERADLRDRRAARLHAPIRSNGATPRSTPRTRRARRTSTSTSPRSPSPSRARKPSISAIPTTAPRSCCWPSTVRRSSRRRRWKT